MKEISQQNRQSFQKEILDWYAKNKRELPWRNTRNPYCILVSEIMSQQTQIARVIPKYEAWMKKFPTLQELAHASTEEVLTDWSGLGYNRRGLFLHRCSQIIITVYGGIFPQDEKVLLGLPGIGKYTARALLCFAFDKQIPVVDTNIRKVILVHFPSTADMPQAIEQVAYQLLPKGKAYEWNQALMDYASLQLKDKKIAIPKQSKFVGSNRYFRGGIMRLLIRYKQLSKEELQKKLLEEENKEISFEKLSILLSFLEKDSLIHINPKTKLITL